MKKVVVIKQDVVAQCTKSWMGLFHLAEKYSCLVRRRQQRKTKESLLCQGRSYLCRKHADSPSSKAHSSICTISLSLILFSICLPITTDWPVVFQILLGYFLKYRCYIGFFWQSPGIEADSKGRFHVFVKAGIFKLLLAVNKLFCGWGCHDPASSLVSGLRRPLETRRKSGWEGPTQETTRHWVATHQISCNPQLKKPCVRGSTISHLTSLRTLE